jgi:hypothetical protein
MRDFMAGMRLRNSGGTGISSLFDGFSCTSKARKSGLPAASLTLEGPLNQVPRLPELLLELPMMGADNPSPSEYSTVTLLPASMLL